jgi:hypothetical protein
MTMGVTARSGGHENEFEGRCGPACFSKLV